MQAYISRLAQIKDSGRPVCRLECAVDWSALRHDFQTCLSVKRVDLLLAEYAADSVVELEVLIFHEVIVLLEISLHLLEH